MTDRKVYSINEFANVLGVSYQTVYRLIRSNQLGHFRVGRQVRIDKELHADPFIEGENQSSERPVRRPTKRHKSNHLK